MYNYSSAYQGYNLNPATSNSPGAANNNSGLQNNNNNGNNNNSNPTSNSGNNTQQGVGVGVVPSANNTMLPDRGKSIRHNILQNTSPYYSRTSPVPPLSHQIHHSTHNHRSGLGSGVPNMGLPSVQQMRHIQPQQTQHSQQPQQVQNQQYAQYQQQQHSQSQQQQTSPQPTTQQIFASQLSNDHQPQQLDPSQLSTFTGQQQQQFQQQLLQQQFLQQQQQSQHQQQPQVVQPQQVQPRQYSTVQMQQIHQQQGHISLQQPQQQQQVQAPGSMSPEQQPQKKPRKQRVTKKQLEQQKELEEQQRRQQQVQQQYQLTADGKKKRGRPKKFIHDPSTNKYIDSSHPHFKALNKTLKDATAAVVATNTNGNIVQPQGVQQQQQQLKKKQRRSNSSTKPAKDENLTPSLSRLFNQPPSMRTLDDEAVQQLLLKKDKRGRPRKFPVEETGITIKGIRVNGNVKHRVQKS